MLRAWHNLVPDIFVVDMSYRVWEAKLTTFHACACHHPLPNKIWKYVATKIQLHKKVNDENFKFISGTQSFLS